MSYEPLSAAPFDFDTTPRVHKVAAHASGVFLEVVQPGGGSRTVVVRDLADGSKKGPAIVAAGYQDAALCPGGDRVAIAEDGVITVHGVADGAARCKTAEAEWFYNGVVWLPGGDAFVGVTQVNEVTVFSAADGTPVRALRADSDSKSFGGIALSPDGASLVHVRGGKVYCLDVATGAERWVTHIGSSPEGASMRPDGAEVVVSTNQGPVRLSMADGQKIQSGLPFPFESGVKWEEPYGESWTRRVAWSPDGAHIAYVAPNGNLWVAPAGDLQAATEHARGETLAWIDSISWVDGSTALVGTAHGKLALVDVAAGSTARDLGPSAAAAPAPAPAAASKPAPAAAPANTPSPVVVALVSFLLPGVGQIMNGQTAKGAVILVVSILTCYLGGLAGILFAVEAYMVATKRQEGKEVGPWSWF